MPLDIYRKYRLLEYKRRRDRTPNEIVNEPLWIIHPIHRWGKVKLWQIRLLIHSQREKDWKIDINITIHNVECTKITYGNLPVLSKSQQEIFLP